MLKLALEGDCVGHPCDNCWLCKRGRCCRKDLPDYKPPEPGDWESPYFGEMGVLCEIDGKVECHCCGKFYRSLHSHVFRSHGLWPDEYKVLFGLNASCNLISSETESKLREHIKVLLAEGKLVLRQGVPLTPEQLSAMLQGRKHSLQAKRNLTVAARKRAENPEYGQKVSHTKTKVTPSVSARLTRDHSSVPGNGRRIVPQNVGRKVHIMQQCTLG
jgi:hypothetical protein